jgi:prepilin-type N-terminal cleavage/methylation domain-containing protein
MRLMGDFESRAAPSTRADARARRRRGFTIIELMMATVLLVVAVAAALSGQILSFNLLKTSRETNLAMSDAQAALELMLATFKDDLAVAGSYAHGVPIAAFNGLHLENEVVTPTYPNYVAGAPVPDPLQIVVTVNWDDWAGRPRTVRLASLKTL